MPRTWFAPLLLLLTALTGSCSKDATAGTRTVLTLTGSSTIAPLATELGRRFEGSRPGLHVDVQSGGSSRGIADVRAGNADIGMASRALAASEGDLTAHTIARDGVGLIVHNKNHVAELSAAQVRAIFTGKITDWQEVGGSPGRITVVNKAEGRATLAVFLEHFELASRDIHADIIAGENEQAIKTVAGTEGAIGYVSIGTAEVDITAGVSIRLLALDGVQATTENVANGTYSLARPLNLVTAGTPSTLALQFIEFAKSSANHDIVRRESFVPIASH